MSALRVGQEITVPIATDHDIVIARQQGRALAGLLGFSLMDATLIAAAISELARNILQYARRGKIVLTAANGEKVRFVVVAQDEAPDVADSHRTQALSRVRSLMDDFQITSEPGATTVTTTLRKR